MQAAHSGPAGKPESSGARVTNGSGLADWQTHQRLLLPQAGRGQPHFNGVEMWVRRPLAPRPPGHNQRSRLWEKPRVGLLGYHQGPRLSYSASNASASEPVREQ